MKKLLIILLITVSTLTIANSVQAAYDFSKNSGAVELGTKLGYTEAQTPEYYIGLVLSVIFSVLGLAFLILTIYAGIKWMTAQGNNSQIESAKDTITRALIGLVICLVSYGITFFVINIFQGQKPSASEIISNSN